MLLRWQGIVGWVALLASLLNAAEASRLAFEVDSDNIKRALSFPHQPSASWTRW